MATYHVVPGGAGGHTGADKANAFDMEEACDAAAADDLFHVYGDGGDYTAEYVTGGAKDCVMYLVTEGNNIQPIVWQGCFDTPGDGGIAIIDASSEVLANAANGVTAGLGNVLKNIEFGGGTGEGFEGQGSPDNMTFKKCRFTNNGGHGVQCDNQIRFLLCSFDNNDLKGADNDGDVAYIACIAYANDDEGLYSTATSIALSCLCYENGDQANIDMGGNSIVANCTCDGENQAASIGINFVDDPAVIINNIIHDHNVGISSDADHGELDCAHNNLFNSNTADVSNFLVPSAGDGVGDRGDVEAVPGFTDEAGDDYTLTAAAAAKATGIDAKFAVDFWDSFIAANNPPVP